MKPKHLLFIAVALIACATGVAAQTHYVPRISAGLHGGATLGQVGFSPSVRESFIQGITAGASLRWAEERHVGIVAELNFAQRGWKENFFENSGRFRYLRRLSYIEIPVMTHIFFGSRRFGGFFNLGPQIGYMISDGIESNFNYAAPATEPSFPSNRQTLQMAMEIKNRFDYGITAGAGMEFYINPRNSVQIEARYYYGLGNIFPSSKKDHFSASRTSMIAITAGYMFRIK